MADCITTDVPPTKKISYLKVVIFEKSEIFQFKFFPKPSVFVGGLPWLNPACFRIEDPSLTV